MEQIKTKFTEYQSRITSWFAVHQILSLFLVFVGIYLAFDIEILWQPFIWSEDTIFLNESLVLGFPSIFNRHAAYLEILSRLSGYISILIGRLTNSYWNVTFMMRAISTLLGAYYIAYFWIEDFDWVLPGRKNRFFVSVLMLIWVCNFYNMMYNITSLHWIGEVYVFLIGLNLIKGRYPKCLDLILLVLTMLNSPEGCIIAAPAVLMTLSHVVKKEKDWKSIMFALLTSACAILQIVMLLTGEYALYDKVEELDFGWHLFFMTTNLFGFMIECPMFLFGNQVTFFAPNPILLLMGGIFWYQIKRLKSKELVSKLIFSYVLLFLFCHYVMVSYKYPIRISQSKDYWEHASVACMMIVFISSTKWDWKNLIKKRTIQILFVFVLCGQIAGIGKIHNPWDKYHIIGKDYYRYDYALIGMDRLNAVLDRVDFSSKNYERVSLYRDWCAMVPVAEEGGES